MLGNRKSVEEFDLDQNRSPRRKTSIRGSLPKRLSGRPNIPSPALKPTSSPFTPVDAGSDDTRARNSHPHLDNLIDQVSEWIKDERSKRAEKKAKRRERVQAALHLRPKGESDWETDASGHRRGSSASEDSFDLEKLEDIVKHTLSVDKRRKSSITSLRRNGSLRKLQRKQTAAGASSDTEYLDNDVHVPSSDAILDNSQTMSYTGGASDDSDSSDDELQRTGTHTDREAWAKFKFEIVRLTHTLRLKGWRRVPLEFSGQIRVQRLSGALTNAVYVVSPPDELPSRPMNEATNGSVSQTKKPPPKLLLRIYGPQVEHLINREAELAILRRLARKKIGPRMLGTFANGRFEEYFYAKTLTAEDIRNPDTSRHIAKRMRELHDGIELLESERDAGPFVWQNWDSWVNRVEKVVSWLDCEVQKLPEDAKPSGNEAWKRRGYICGVPWKQFRATVEKYRSWLESHYASKKDMREQLVFAHNDAQYGNILRLMPTGESPLMLPANTHKQLVVIDFEYANANVPGMEFANHFTEWCYNYHDAKKPYAFHPKRYPTPEDQDRFIRSYVRHRPQFNVSTPNLGPTEMPESAGATYFSETPGKRPTSSISDFMHDARNPSSSSTPQLQGDGGERSAEDQEIKRLMDETRLWRLANTAMWVAWGLVQAKVPGMPDFDSSPVTAEQLEDEAHRELGEDAEEYRELAEKQQQAAEQAEHPEAQEPDEEFDYLGYAQHRAMFFWGDVIRLGLVKAEELPEELRDKVKTVPY